MVCLAVQANLRRSRMNASDKDSSAAKHLSALGASKGGHARAAKLSARERSRIAQKAARARWGKADDQEEHQPEIIRGKGLFEDAATLAEDDLGLVFILV